MTNPYTSPLSQDAPQGRPTLIRYQVLAVLMGITAIAYIQRSAISGVTIPLEDEFKLQKVDIGNIMAAFYAGYTILQIPSGWMVERWGARRVLTGFALLWSICTAVAAWATGFWSLTVIWFLVGLLQAGIFPCIMSCLANWLPTTRRAFASGLLGAFMCGGAALATSLVGILVDDVGWRRIFLLASVPGVLWALGFYAWYRNQPAQHHAVNTAELALISADKPQSQTSSENVIPLPWGTLLRSGRMWLLCLQQFCRAFAFVLFVTWFSRFLIAEYKLSAELAGLYNSWPLIAAVIGSLFGGAISDWLLVRTGSRRIARQGVAVCGLGICALLVGVSVTTDSPMLGVWIISLGSFMASVGGVSAYTTAMDLGGAHVATVFAMMNMCGNIGAMAFPTTAGWLVQKTDSWDAVMLVVAANYAIAMLCWLVLNTDGTLFDRHDSAVLDDEGGSLGAASPSTSAA